LTGFVAGDADGFSSLPRNASTCSSAYRGPRAPSSAPAPRGRVGFVPNRAFFKVKTGGNFSRRASPGGWPAQGRHSNMHQLRRFGKTSCPERFRRSGPGTGFEGVHPAAAVAPDDVSIVAENEVALIWLEFGGNFRVARLGAGVDAIEQLRSLSDRSRSLEMLVPVGNLNDVLDLGIDARPAWSSRFSGPHS